MLIKAPSFCKPSHLAEMVFFGQNRLVFQNSSRKLAFFPQGSPTRLRIPENYSGGNPALQAVAQICTESQGLQPPAVRALGQVLPGKVCPEGQGGLGPIAVFCPRQQAG